MSQNTPLTILSTSVRQDAGGRYCLNDCHRAAGALDKDAPAQWLRTETAKKLIAELETMQECTVSETAEKPVVTVPGRNGGTYAVKELVYAYAMWISPAFHLTVIRAFDALVRGKDPTPKPKAPRAPALIGPRRQTLGLIELYTRVNEMRGLDRNAALISANDRATVKTGINLFEEAGPVRMEAPDQEPVMNVTAIAEAIGGISNRRINPALIEMGYQTKGGKGCRCPYQATELGKQHSRVVDSPRRHASGFSQELLWKASIIPLIKAHLAGATSPYAAVALAADTDLVPQGGLL
ncbi:KilA-N domain-containing protein [Gluconacetobacter sacchari DSM 12717]|uniref:KilA-N domain-containing protein n=2 Tax=Gluconacetobacter sacchari TaxID=92759 RepID=A0A7W4IAQ5_9PROT|nr:KilA-N domain-containing protein [Gluconacetobacter sacchari]MBB2159334.1 KilA-N domain-containing protein [Gluconacetobacter sacchari]GBQ19435.1 KilA-N domain-containing protein [Gluconacetobacter sacchari DSM 12717]